MLRRARESRQPMRPAVRWRPIGSGRPGVDWRWQGMAETEDLVDAIAGFSLFADLSDPQLERVVHRIGKVGVPVIVYIVYGFAGRLKVTVRRN